MSITTDELKEMFEFETIHTEPVYSLANCIAATEQRRAAIDEDIEDCADPVSEIAKRFRTGIFLCNKKELDFLRFAAELTEKNAAWEDNIDYNPFNVFSYNDFVYLFLWENKYYLVMPEELISTYREVMADEDFTATNTRMLELSAYAAALLNLYGAYEEDHFMAVWNHHHKDKITLQEAVSFLSDRAYFHSDFHFFDGFVVHDCLDEDEFDELWSETEDMDYYMPTKSVIRKYANRGYDDSTIPGEQEMNDFLAEYIRDEWDLEELQFDIVESCERLRSPDEVKEILEDANAPLDNEEFCGKFVRLYNNLRDNTHIWELRGFTPYQYQTETGDTIHRFTLPKR